MFFQKASLFFLRVSLGGLFLYAGVSKLTDPSWSAAGYLAGAQAFQGFYAWLASPGILPVVDFLNAWGLTLVGAALVLGIATRLAVLGGVTMMALYYLALGFPRPNAHALVIDEHIIFIASLLVVGAFGAGRAWGLGSAVLRVPLVSRSAFLRALLA